MGRLGDRGIKRRTSNIERPTSNVEWEKLKKQRKGEWGVRNKMRMGEGRIEDGETGRWGG